MSDIASILVIMIAASMALASNIKEEDRLKVLSALWLVVILLSSSIISTDWARMTSELVDDEGDSHYGLPDIWE